MLLDDAVIAQQFAVLLRAAEALKQATILPPRPPVPTSPYPHLDGSLSTPSDASSIPPAARDYATNSLGAMKATSVFGLRQDRAVSLDQMDLSCLDGPVQLSRTVGDKEVNRLRGIGLCLEGVAALLQQSLDAKLVDFYTHLSKKVEASTVPGMRATNASTTSSATRVQCPPRKPLDTWTHTGPPAATSHAGPASILHDKSPPQPPQHTAAAAPPSSAAPLSAWSPVVKAETTAASALETSGGESAPSRQRTAFVLDPHADSPSPLTSMVLSLAGETDASALEHSRQDDGPGGSSRRSSLHQSKGLGSRKLSAYAPLHNAPMARRMEEEGAAASELQSFFFLLLEAALRLTDATAAAIYLDDATLHPTGVTGEQPFRRSSVFAGAAARGVGRHASIASTTTNAAAGASAPTSRAHFLQCVAHVHGNFPNTISCATTNVLTTVVQTGIAVNLNYSESSAVLRPSGLDGTSSDGSAATGRGGTSPPRAKAATAEAAATNASPYLNMYNGVVVPVKGVGCLVLANKAKRPTTLAGAVPPRFSVCDEHVAWSSALISEAVLQLYDRELLMRAAGWAPPCAAVLRPFLHAREAAPSPPSSTLTTAVDGKRLESQLGSRRRLPASPSVKFLPDPAALLDGWQKEEAASLVFNTRNDIFARRLTIVRTEDRQIGKALPPELRMASPATMSAPATQKVVTAVTRSGGAAAGSLNGTSGQLNDEDLFLAAAQYINNLESLWRKAIADSNTMHIMADNYNREIQLRGEKIVYLESQVRGLNAHVAQLERRNNPARFYPTTTLQS